MTNRTPSLALTPDTFALIFAHESITLASNHLEFDPESYDSAADAIADDIDDLIHNANEYDYAPLFDLDADDDDDMTRLRDCMTDDATAPLIAKLLTLLPTARPDFAPFAD